MDSRLAGQAGARDRPAGWLHLRQGASGLLLVSHEIFQSAWRLDLNHVVRRLPSIYSATDTEVSRDPAGR